MASSAAEIERGYTDLATAAAGNVYRWRVTLPYLDPGVAVEAGETVRRTATFFSICAWIRLASPRWRFSSLAELIDRSELGRHTGVDGWKGGSEDIVLLRIPLSISLRGKFGEKIRARLTGGGCSLIEVSPAVDLRFEEA